MTTSVPILEYHDLADRVDHTTTFHSPYILSKSNFYEQMSWLSRNRYTTLTIDDLFNGQIPAKSVVLTFDDGHISNYELAFPILEEFEFIATFFVASRFIGATDYLASEQIAEMCKHGMKFESHSMTHPYMLSLSRKDITREICQSREEIQSIAKSKVNHFSVPYGFYNAYLAWCVKKAGYQSIVTEDFGYYEYRDSVFQILPRFTVKPQIRLSKFANIAAKRRVTLMSDYLTALSLQYIKWLLGYRRYIHFKSLILKAEPPRFVRHTDENPACH